MPSLAITNVVNFNLFLQTYFCRLHFSAFFYACQIHVSLTKISTEDELQFPKSAGHLWRSKGKEVQVQLCEQRRSELQFSPENSQGSRTFTKPPSILVCSIYTSKHCNTKKERARKTTGWICDGVSHPLENVKGKERQRKNSPNMSKIPVCLSTLFVDFCIIYARKQTTPVIWISFFQI